MHPCLSFNVHGHSTWNDVILPALNLSAVSVLDNSTAALTIPPIPEYAIQESETVLVTVPPVAVRSGQAIDATPQFEIIPAAPTAILDASAFVGIDETVLLGAYPPALNISLVGDTWDLAVGNATDVGGVTLALLLGFFSMQSEPGGWNALVRPLFSHSSLVRISDNLVQILLPQATEFDINAPETVVLTVPKEAVRGCGMSCQHDRPLPA